MMHTQQTDDICMCVYFFIFFWGGVVKAQVLVSFLHSIRQIQLVSHTKKLQIDLLSKKYCQNIPHPRELGGVSEHCGYVRYVYDFV